ncbi:MAG: aminomethyl-transferring glycine dehydrogenase subunit GcvPB [Chloroflexi bacterium]|nr:aminomethyl-transferring glycine dehydrogenase subunit GcvPB [Chloroflexota bacterium]
MTAPKPAEPLLSELSQPGRRGHQIPLMDDPAGDLPADLLREDLKLPELSELDVVRHFTHLSSFNFSVDAGFYPLGSCTMKYNPKINDEMARLPGFAALHPYQPEETVQGALRLMYEIERFLASITGFAAATLQPAAGAHGELCGMLMIREALKARGEAHRKKVLVPDSAHGTNPATAAMCGFYTQSIPTDERGNVDLARLKAEADGETVGLMLTNPNTLGLFEEHVLEITHTVHQAGGLVYGDGANLNAILGVVRPAEAGFDVMHINLHKTFSQPHGSGGPGAGPVVVSAELEPFLPVPVVRKHGDAYRLELDRPSSIGRLKAFAGHFGVLVRAWTYIVMHGGAGLLENSRAAVLNANYLRVLLRDVYDLAYDRTCMHEFVLSGVRQKREGARTLDMAKRLIDFGYHPPTIYFPLIVEEALMIEPTETESQETLDGFAETMRQIAHEARTDPEVVRSAPHNAVVGRLDEVRAARQPILRWSW